MVRSGDPIYALDYNTIRNKVASVLGSGSGSQGYGQTLVSSGVFKGNLIAKAHWDNLRYDIVNAYLHQTGVLPSIVSVGSATDYIGGTAGYPANNYDSLADQLLLNRFSIGPGQSMVTSSVATRSRTGAWSTRSECTLTVTFANADQARYFFNSGGKLRFTSSRTGGSITDQNNSWTTTLNTAIGTVEFGGIVPDSINFYSLTTGYQQVYQGGSSGLYTPNYYRIEALCNCSGANNSTGTANIITFLISWNDGYTDPDGGGTPHPPGDEVDGTLTLTVDEFKAVGDMPPSSPFSITSPGYSLSSISAS
jgi:hypothetical protein